MQYWRTLEIWYNVSWYALFSVKQLQYILECNCVWGFLIPTLSLLISSSVTFLPPIGQVYDLCVLMILWQVSKLLALMCVVSSISKQFSLLSFSRVLSENYWSSYFHQASIGTHLTHQFLSHPSGRSKVGISYFVYQSKEFYICIMNTDFWIQALIFGLAIGKSWMSHSLLFSFCHTLVAIWHFFILHSCLLPMWTEKP